MVAIVDYGVGNLYSLTCSLGHIGAECAVTREENALRADQLIHLREEHQCRAGQHHDAGGDHIGDPCTSYNITVFLHGILLSRPTSGRLR